jgi:hypothetical protein
MATLRTAWREPPMWPEASGRPAAPVVSFKARALPWTRQKAVALWTPDMGFRKGDCPFVGSRGDAPGTA